MKNKFAITSNVEELLAAMSRTEERGAREASWVVVEGKAGFGKTEAMQWFAIKNQHVYLRANPGWTASWFLRDLLIELQHMPGGTRCVADLFEQTAQALLSQPQTIIIDEADHCLQDTAKVLETIRALSDRQKFPVVIVGHEGLGATLKRFPHVHSRVAEFVKFREATAADVKALVGARAEVEVDEKVIPAVLKQSGGRPRLILNAIAKIEAVAKQNGGKFDLTSLLGEPLVVNPSKRAA